MDGLLRMARTLKKKRGTASSRSKGPLASPRASFPKDGGGGGAAKPYFRPGETGASFDVVGRAYDICAYPAQILV